MLHEVDLPFHRRARVWLGLRPPCLFSAEGAFTRRLPCSEVVSPSFEAAIEIVIPRGPMTSYGLLGVQCATYGNQLELKVGQGPGAGANVVFGDSLLRGDRVLVGLTAEYAAAVLDAAENASKFTVVPCGRLIFNCAAHAEVGSSPRIFRTLTSLLIHGIAHIGHDDDALPAWKAELEAADW